VSEIFHTITQLNQDFYRMLAEHADCVEEDLRFPWPNHVFKSTKFRRAHLDVVDARATKKLYMMHLCVFPHVTDTSPIYGFDLIAGPNKVTGVFHDFSAGEHKQHFMLDFFAQSVKDQIWSKPRVLPDWAKNIFSDHMVAAGNIQDPIELSCIAHIAMQNLDYYLNNVGKSCHATIDSTAAQNRYCYNQRQNPHTPKVMTSLGLDPDMVIDFIHNCLFPEVDQSALPQPTHQVLPCELT
jgi:hypothetical protein